MIIIEIVVDEVPEDCSECPYYGSHSSRDYMYVCNALPDPLSFIKIGTTKKRPIWYCPLRKYRSV